MIRKRDLAGTKLDPLKNQPLSLIRESGTSLEEIICLPMVQSISPEPLKNTALPWNLRNTSKIYKGESLKYVVHFSTKSKENAKRKFSISLPKKDIEADFQFIKGKNSQATEEASKRAGAEEACIWSIFLSLANFKLLFSD